MASARPGRWSVLLGCIALLALIIGGVVLAVKNRSVEKSPTTAEEQPTTLHGFSLSPQSFEVDDYLGFFNTAAEHGNTLSWAGPYQDLTKDTGNAARTVVVEAKKRSLTPVIITGPGKSEVFDGTFTAGFRSAVLNFVKTYEVPYLGLGNEIDEVYRDSPARYTTLASTLEALAAEVKTASPKTTVFTIFQLERTKGLQGGLFGKQNNRGDTTWQLISDLKNFDSVAFTSYPGLIYKTPTEIPEEYYSEIANHTALPIFFTEIGWFRTTPVTGWDANADEQANFINTFDELTNRLSPRLVIWPFLYDQKVASPFDAMGLLGLDEDSSPGLAAWDLARANDSGD
jgi:hypothetical protein